MRKGEIPLFAAAVEILGRHALVADEPAALVVAEPYAGLVVDEHEVPCQIGKARMGCPLGDPHLLATLLVLGVGRKLVAEIRGEGLVDDVDARPCHAPGPLLHPPDERHPVGAGRRQATLSGERALPLNVLADLVDRQRLKAEH